MPISGVVYLEWHCRLTGLIHNCCDEEEPEGCYTGCCLIHSDECTCMTMSRIHIPCSAHTQISSFLDTESHVITVVTATLLMKSAGVFGFLAFGAASSVCIFLLFLYDAAFYFQLSRLPWLSQAPQTISLILWSFFNFCPIIFHGLETLAFNVIKLY